MFENKSLVDIKKGKESKRKEEEFFVYKPKLTRNKKLKKNQKIDKNNPFEKLSELRFR